MRRFLLASLCFLPLQSLFAGSFGFDNAPAQINLPSMQARNHSWNSWSNYENPWNYFPVADYQSRQKMLAWAEQIYARATQVERQLTRLPASAQSRNLLTEIRSIRKAALDLHRNILFGTHQGDLFPLLSNLDLALQSQDWLKTNNPAIVRQRHAIRQLQSDIHGFAGPELQTPPVLSSEPEIEPATTKSDHRGLKKVGLSASSR